MPLANKLEARIKRYRSGNTVCQDADLLRRFFALKIPYKSVIPLQPEPLVEFAYTTPVLKGFEALDELFYADVTSYMKSAESKPSTMTQQVSPSKKLDQQLAAGFEALDREFYSIESTDDEAASEASSVPTAVNIKPQNALLSLLGGDPEEEEAPPPPKRARRLEALNATKELAGILNPSRKKKEK